MPNKIESELSSEKLQEFLDRCWKTQGLSLAKVQALAGEYGITVSLMGARTFRNSTFRRHVERIGKVAELREELRAGVEAGNTVAQAASQILSSDVLDALVDREERPGVEELDVMSKVVKRLCDSSRGDRALAHRIEQDRGDAVKRMLKEPALLKEIAKIAGDKTLTDEEKSARVQLRLWGEQPANFKPHTATRDTA